MGLCASLSGGGKAVNLASKEMCTLVQIYRCHSHQAAVSLCGSSYTNKALRGLEEKSSGTDWDPDQGASFEAGN